MSKCQTDEPILQRFANAQITKASALRRAQLALLVEYEIPYFWAPYVLVGNWLEFWHYTLTVTAQLDGSLLAEE